MLSFCYEGRRLPPYRKLRDPGNEVAKYKQINRTHVDGIAG